MMESEFAHISAKRAPSPSAADVLTWLEANGTQILIQTLPSYRRSKNKIIVGYRDSAGALQACGGRSITEAVLKAAARKQTSPGRNVLVVPGERESLNA